MLHFQHNVLQIQLNYDALPNLFHAVILLVLFFYFINLLYYIIQSTVCHVKVFFQCWLVLVILYSQAAVPFIGKMWGKVVMLSTVDDCILYLQSHNSSHHHFACSFSQLAVTFIWTPFLPLKQWKGEVTHIWVMSVWEGSLLVIITNVWGINAKMLSDAWTLVPFIFFKFCE